MQHTFIKSRVFNGLIVALAVVGAHRLFSGLPDRAPAADRHAIVRFEPVRFTPKRFAPLRIAGAWRVTSTEPRLGGVSALAVDDTGLLALTDSGVLIRLPKPEAPTGVAQFRDLPAGPGRGFFKAGRDSEALARDAAGRGWWVLFENAHSAWLFDRDFDRVSRTIDLGSLGWRANMGAEGAVSGARGLMLFPESGEEVVELGVKPRLTRSALLNRYGRLSDAAMLPTGQIVVIARSYGPAGFSSRLLLFDGEALRPLARLAVGRLDNAEAIAAEPLDGGGVRLWVMTDNDYRRRVPTLLIALDWRGTTPR